MKPDPEADGTRPDESHPDALKALNRLFGKDLYLAKFDSCVAAFNAISAAENDTKKRHELERHFHVWKEKSAEAIHKWVPDYVELAGARRDKWEWVDDQVKRKLRAQCVGLGQAERWGKPWQTTRDKPIESWEPVEWWVRNACNTGPTFLILRSGKWVPPEWLAPISSDTYDPIGDYQVMLEARLMRELEDALDLANLSEGKGVTQETSQTSSGLAPRTSEPLPTLPVKEPSDLILGQWAEDMLEEGKLVAGALRGGKRPDELRSQFPRFFVEVLDRLYEAKRNVFIEQAQRLRLTVPMLMEWIGDVKGLKGPSMYDLRQKYRRATGKTRKVQVKRAKRLR
jgi:hypothetical protein